MKLEAQGISKRLRFIVGLYILIPVLAIVVGLYALAQVQTTYLRDKYGLDNIQFKYVPDSVHVYDSLTEPYFLEIKEKSINNADVLIDATYLAKLNRDLEEHASYLIIKADGIITFIGDSQSYNDLDKTALDVKEGLNYSDEFSTYIGGDNPILLKCTEFQFEGGDPGYIYIITDLTKTIPESTMFIEFSLLLVFTTIIVTAFWVMFIIGRRYVKPLQKLEKILIKIAQGNYEESVKVGGTSEIKNIGYTVEAIKESLQNQKQLYIDQEQEMREVLSNISHDLKTPITSIKGYGEALRDGVADNEEKRMKYRKIIVQKANEMDKLLNELSLYSKVHMKHMLYDFQYLNVKDYFDDCIEEFESDLEQKGIRLVYANYVSDDTMIWADPAQLSRVKHNIINNSVKYMDKRKGVIIISVAEVNNTVEIKFEDNGAGIEHEELVHVFDRFYRTDKSRNSNTGGSGIGLSIAKDIIDEHKGKIWATSKEGVGTIMHINLPKITGDKDE